MIFLGTQGVAGVVLDSEIIRSCHIKREVLLGHCHTLAKTNFVSETCLCSFSTAIFNSIASGNVTRIQNQPQKLFLSLVMPQRAKIIKMISRLRTNIQICLGFSDYTDLLDREC